MSTILKYEKESMSIINLNYSFCKYNCTCAPNGLKTASQKRDRKKDVGKSLLTDVSQPNSPITVHPFPLPWPEVPTAAEFTMGKRAKEPKKLLSWWEKEGRRFLSGPGTSLLGNWKPRMGVGPCTDLPFAAVASPRLEVREGETGRAGGCRTCHDKSQAASGPTELFSGASAVKRGGYKAGVCLGH